MGHEVGSSVQERQEAVERLTRDFDHLDRALTMDVAAEVFRRFREQPGVAHTDAHGGYYLLTRYDDVLEAQRTVGARCPAFSYADGILHPVNGRAPSIPVDFDEPIHGEYRKLFTNILNRAKVHELEPAIRDEVSKVVGAFLDMGEGDFSAEVARRLPIAVMGRLMGWSDAVSDRTAHLVLELMKGFESEGIPPALIEFQSLFQHEVDERRRAPRADYLTELVETEIDGRPLTDGELLNALVTFVFGGYETSAATIGQLMLDLARDPELQERLRSDPRSIPAAIEETFRLYTPNLVQFRTTTSDVEIDGTSIPHGSRVGVVWAAANRDPAHFEDPDQLRLDRPNGRKHVAFGYGVHLCSGIHLARLELAILFEELLASGRRFELAGEPVHGGFHIGNNTGWAELPIRCVPI